MRLWSLHPRYLDTRGLVALWREGLLAQAVLRGKTHGYRHHPQLTRFRDRDDPVAWIAAYLRVVQAEGERRGFHLDARRIARKHAIPRGERIPVTRGQIAHEWAHLLAKLERRSPDTHRDLEGLTRPRTHPLFRVKEGGVESWERPESTAAAFDPGRKRR